MRCSTTVYSGAYFQKKRTDLLVRADHQAHAHAEHLLALRDDRDNMAGVASACARTKSFVPSVPRKVKRNGWGQAARTAKYTANIKSMRYRRDVVIFMSNWHNLDKGQVLGTQYALDTHPKL